MEAFIGPFFVRASLMSDFELSFIMMSEAWNSIESMVERTKRKACNVNDAQFSIDADLCDRETW